MLEWFVIVDFVESHGIKVNDVVKKVMKFRAAVKGVA